MVLFSNASYLRLYYIPYDALSPSVASFLLRLRYALFLTRLYALLTVLLAYTV